MLMARNADMCSRCLVTEPSVRSFIGAKLRSTFQLLKRRMRELRVTIESHLRWISDSAQGRAPRRPQTVVAGVRPAISILSTSCCRGRRNRRRDSSAKSLLPARTMQDENDQPDHERKQPAGNGNKH